MGQLSTIYRKEIIYFWRSKQFVWLPIVLMIFAVLDALSYYYLPEIIQWSGGLPEGTVFEATSLEAYDAVMMGIDQLSFIGSLIIIAISMGVIAKERQAGLAEIIFTKPIHPATYIMAKWFALITITTFSLFLALLFNWIYVNELFGAIAFQQFLFVFIFYNFWFSLIVTITVFFNSFLSQQGIVFASSAITVFLMSAINMAFGHRLTYFPNQLSIHIKEMLINQEVSKALLVTSAIILLLNLILLMASIFIFKRKKI